MHSDKVTNASADVTNASADDIKLDRLLHDWTEQTTDADRLDDLRNRIISSLATTDAEPADDVARQASAPQPQRFVWMSGVVVASAAVLLVSMTFFPLRSTDRSTDPLQATDIVAANSQRLPDDAWLRDDQLQSKAALLAAMEETFDGHLHWLAETGNDVKLGLAASTSRVDVGADNDVRMAVRIVVERRSPNTNTWQVAWAMDVLTREEQIVNTFDADSELTLWTYQLPDGHIAIDSELTLTGINTLHAISSGLQHDRQPVRIIDESIVSEHVGDIQYRIFQTVAVIEQEVA